MTGAGIGSSDSCGWALLGCGISLPVRVWGLGLGFGVSGLGFRVWGFGFRVWGFRLRVSFSAKNLAWEAFFWGRETRGVEKNNPEP